MKIESLNIWGGRMFDPLITHLKKQAEVMDIFCFQEVYSTPLPLSHTRDTTPFASNPHVNDFPARANIYEELQKALRNFQGLYFSSQKGIDYHGAVDYELYFGLAIFIKKGLPILKSGDTFVHRSKDSGTAGDNSTLGRNVAYVQVQSGDKTYTVMNFHGLWNGKGKIDTPERILQSTNIKTFTDALTGRKVLCGDFNLLPATKSMKILEKGMINLIKEYGITSTRSELYSKPEKYADYAFISPDIQVNDFAVLQETVSDHLPLFLDLS